jgi:chromosomal replication initiator protein
VTDAKRLWAQAANYLRAQVPDAAWNTCFASISPTMTDDGHLRLAVPSPLARRRIEERYLPLVTQAVAQAAGFDVVIDLDVAADSRAEPASPTSPVEELAPPDGNGARTRTRRAYEQALNERFRFESFVTGPSNRLTHAAARAVAEHPGNAYNPLFIHGASGLGKTHLLHAIGNYLAEHFSRLRVRYVKTETFVNHFIDAIRNNATQAFKQYYRHSDVLLVDDIQFLVGKDQSREEFFHTFNAVYDDAHQIVITSDRPPRHLKTLEDRLTSRFLSGLITDIHPPELETRLAILRMKATGQHVPVPEDVLELIASHVTDNIRELEGALTRLTASAKLDGKNVTPELAEELLEDVFSTNGGHQITPSLILTVTSELFGFSVEELCGHSRRRPLVLARQMSMYVFRTLTDCSYPEIARHFGGRDHTTVIHAVDKIGNLMNQSRPVFQQVDELTRRVRAGG